MIHSKNVAGQSETSAPRPARLFYVVVLSAALGCSDSTAEGRADAGATHADGGRRVLQRTVAIDLFRLTTREMTQGPDGKPVFGNMKDLEGADVCIKQRRKAFDAFKPFEPVEPAICVKSVAGQPARIEHAPANSDLVLTVEYPGMRPVALTERTGDYDVPAPGLAMTLPFVMLKPDDEKPWIESKPKPDAKSGLVDFRDQVTWAGDGPARPEVTTDVGESLWGFPNAPNVDVGGLKMLITPAGGADAFEITTVSTAELSFVWLPEGSARVKLENTNKRKTCPAVGADGSGQLIGLLADADGTIELPVIAGHDHLTGFVCTCANGPGDGELLDLAACKFAPASDAGDTDGG